jgi:hypothetical protein
LGQQGLQQDSGAEVVRRHVPVNSVHALTNTHFRGQMHDRIDTLDGPRNDNRIAHITNNQVYFTQYRIRGLASVHLIEQAIQDSDVITT